MRYPNIIQDISTHKRQHSVALDAKQPTQLMIALRCTHWPLLLLYLRCIYQELTGFHDHEFLLRNPLVLPGLSAHGQRKPQRLAQGGDVEVGEGKLGCHGVLWWMKIAARAWSVLVRCVVLWRWGVKCEKKTQRKQDRDRRWSVENILIRPPFFGPSNPPEHSAGC